MVLLFGGSSAGRLSKSRFESEATRIVAHHLGSDNETNEDIPMEAEVAE
jgi:hypothetical protein